MEDSESPKTKLPQTQPDEVHDASKQPEEVPTDIAEPHSGQPDQSKHHVWRWVLVVITLIIPVALGFWLHHSSKKTISISEPETSSSSSKSTSPATTGSCAKPNPSNPTFASVSSNHLIDTQGQVMVPNGITISGLSFKNWQTTSSLDDAQITAAITKWCTNFVRLQVAPANLLSGQSYNSAFLQTLKSEVNLALSYDQNVILTAQTEHYNTQTEEGPTAQTIQYWQTLAPVFKSNPRVWFDVYNEPRQPTNQLNTMWVDWQNGVTTGSKQYVGMQQVASAIRQAAGSTNLIIIEGPGGGTTLANLSTHYISGPNIAYAVHSYNEINETQWNYHFGDAASAVPVIDDEWSEYANSKGECHDNAATFVPQFFSYLHQKQIGLGAWSLLPGVLVTNTTTFTPTQITSTYSCDVPSAQKAIMTEDAGDNGSIPDPEGQGVGQLLQNYFSQYYPN